MLWLGNGRDLAKHDLTRAQSLGDYVCSSHSFKEKTCINMSLNLSKELISSILLLLNYLFVCLIVFACACSNFGGHSRSLEKELIAVPALFNVLIA